MIQAARDWLPAAALTDEVVRAGCVEVVTAWSARWSQQPALAVRDLAPSARRRALPNGERRLGRAVQIMLGDTRALQLARWALGIDENDQPLTDGDRSVLLGMGEEIALDLILALSDHFGVRGDDAAENDGRDGERSGDAIALDLDMPGHDARLQVRLPAADLARYRKSRCTARQILISKITSPIPALPDAEIAFTATLGKSSLSLRDIRSMEVGDVVRLDTRLDGTIRISRAGDDGAVFGATFQQEGNAAVLTLRAPDALGAK